MSLDLVLSNTEAHSVGSPRDSNEKNKFTVKTEFVHIKEEIEEFIPFDLSVKNEPPNEYEVPFIKLENSDKSQEEIKIEICAEDETAHESNTEGNVQDVKLNIPEFKFVNGFEKRFDDGICKNVSNNPQNNYLNNTDNLRTNGFKNKARGSSISKKKRVKEILERLRKENIKKIIEGNAGSLENENLDGKVIVDVVSTPELQGELLSSDSDAEASISPQILTIREGFPQEIGLDDKTCPVCHEAFSTPANMQRHFYIHTKNTNYVCQICNIKFWRRQELTKHMFRHDVREFKCDMCERRFKTKSNLNQHIKCHTERFTCHICEKSYPKRDLYEKHVNRKLCRRKGELLRCPVCFKGFKYECSFKRHVVLHSPNRPYICDMCSMDFETKSEIANHIDYHTRARPFKCSVCPKRFANMSFRRAHMRVHTGEKPFKCPICDRHFTHKHNMERHAERHGKVKKLSCDICGRVFPRESRLVYHMRCHFDMKPFSCEICPKKFSHKQNVKKHYSIAHPGSVYYNEETDATVAYKAWHEVQKKLATPEVLEEDTEQILS